LPAADLRRVLGQAPDRPPSRARAPAARERRRRDGARTRDGAMSLADPETRAARRRGEHRPQPIPVSPLAKDRVIAGVPARVFMPPEVRGAYVHLHGGGFVFGSSRLQDDRLEALATTCRVMVVSVEYRLAPEEPYPAGPDDCE